MDQNSSNPSLGRPYNIRNLAIAIRAALEARGNPAEKAAILATPTGFTYGATCDADDDAIVVYDVTNGFAELLGDQPGCGLDMDALCQQIAEKHHQGVTETLRGALAARCPKDRYLKVYDQRWLELCKQTNLAPPFYECEWSVYQEDALDRGHLAVSPTDAEGQADRDYKKWRENAEKEDLRFVRVPYLEDSSDQTYEILVDFDAAVAAGRDRIRAVEVEGKYYYYAEQVARIFAVLEEELASLGASKFDERDRKANYSLWCTTCGQEVEEPNEAVLEALGRGKGLDDEAEE